jgi:hypothetical protein
MKKITLLLFLFFSFQAFSQFTENFESGIPADWSVINGGDTNTWNVGTVAAGTAHSGTKVARIFYDDVLAHNDYLITKQFTVTANLTNRLSLWARQIDNTFPEPFDILVSTTGNSEPDFTNVVASQVSLTTDWQNFTYSLNSYVGQTIYIAFRSTTTAQYHLYLDDISVDAIPLAVPSCAQNQISTPNPSCGNLSTTVSWSIDAAASGYNISVGTTSGGIDIINNQDIGYVDSFEILNQTPNTSYFWKLTPYNLVGQAVSCNEISYTTFSVPCYCTPNPTAVDGYGLTNVSMGTINNTTQIESGNYGDFSTQITNAARGTAAPIAMTFDTNNFAYNVVIWVDWNNDFDFDDDGEKVVTGSFAASMIPVVYDGLVSVPNNASLGQHRMRVSGQFYTLSVNPCYSGDFAAFEDYTLNITPALGVNQFEASDISYYPNPVVDVLNIKSDSKISNIEVYNLLGQKVDSKILDSNRIDLSNLASGTYLVKFTSDTLQQSIKVIKQ